MLSKPKLVIGLTGGIGSGKTTVCDLFAKLGVTIIDTDLLSRDVTQPGQPAFSLIVKHFGEQNCVLDGKLNRRHLREIIFNNPAERRWLEETLHPLIRNEINYRIKHASSPYCIVAIPLLFETEPNPAIQRILVIDAPETLQKERALKRDETSLFDIEAIMQAQASRSTRLDGADDVIHNDGNMESLIAQVSDLHEFYLDLANDPLQLPTL